MLFGKVVLDLSLELRHIDMAVKYLDDKGSAFKGAKKLCIRDKTNGMYIQQNYSEYR